MPSIAFAAAARGQGAPPDSSIISIAPLTHAPSSAWGAHAYVIDSAEIARSTAPTLSELLQARVPGLRVLRSGGMASDGSLVMMRGPISMTSPNAPVLIVDGLRVDARQADTLFSFGAVSPSRWDDIPAEDIERIEVLSGPAAALYGEAADGAVIVTTKSGHGGPLRFSGRVASLTDLAPDEFPANYRGIGVSPSTGQPIPCTLLAEAAKQCTQTRLDVWNPLEQASPFRLGQSAMGHVAMQGAPLGTGIYLSITATNREGVLPHDELSRLGFRGRLTRSLPGGFTLDAFGSFLRNNARMGLDGGYFDYSDFIGRGLTGNAENDSLHGYANYDGPGRELVYPSQRLRSTTGGVLLRWQPLPWFGVAATTGRDNATEHWQIDAFAPDVFPIRERANEFNQVSSSAVRGGFRYGVWLLGPAATSVVVERRTTHNGTSDLHVVTGVVGVNQTAFETYSTSAMLLQTLTLPNDLVVNGSLQQFARKFVFGAEQKEWFPGLNGSWRVPLPRGATDVRLSAAYAEAPGPAPDINTSRAIPTSYSKNPPHLERMHDSEIGADATMGADVTASVTFFRSRATDIYGIYPVIAPNGELLPSRNTIENRGVEARLGMKLIRLARFGWDASMSLATLRNRVTVLQQPTDFRNGAFVKQGAPLWAQAVMPYTYSDANHDGIIDTSEVRLGAPTIAGPPLPTFEAGLMNELRLPGRLTVSALLDYRHGNKVLNLSEEYRCVQHETCRGSEDPSAPLDEQAAAAAALKSFSEPVAGFVNDGSFLKVRELSVSWLMPERWWHHLGGRAALTLAGRNLATATNYNGIDPEISSRRPNQLPRVEFARNPIPREFLLRLDLGGAQSHH